MYFKEIKLGLFTDSIQARPLGSLLAGINSGKCIMVKGE